MTVYDRHSIPESVGRGTLDPELEAWLPHGPTLGADSRACHAATEQLADLIKTKLNGG